MRVSLSEYGDTIFSSGVELNRKSPRATWARNKKNLRAQLHIHEPNIVREISIFHKYTLIKWTIPSQLC